MPAGSSRKRANDGASEQNEQLQLGSLVVNSKQGMVQGYSSTQIKVVFTPAVQGPVREQISIAFRCVHCSNVQTGMAQHCIDAAPVQQLSNGCIAKQSTTAALLHHPSLMAQCWLNAGMSLKMCVDSSMCPTAKLLAVKGAAWALDYMLLC